MHANEACRIYARLPGVGLNFTPARFGPGITALEDEVTPWLKVWPCALGTFPFVSVVSEVPPVGSRLTHCRRPSWPHAPHALEEAE